MIITIKTLLDSFVVIFEIFKKGFDMDLFLNYLFSRFDSIQLLLVSFIVVSGVVSFIMAIFFLTEDGPFLEQTALRKIFKVFFSIFCFSCLLCVLIPSTDKAYELYSIEKSKNISLSSEITTEFKKEKIKKTNKIEGFSLV